MLTVTPHHKYMQSCRSAHKVLSATFLIQFDLRLSVHPFSAAITLIAFIFFTWQLVNTVALTCFCIMFPSQFVNSGFDFLGYISATAC